LFCCILWVLKLLCFSLRKIIEIGQNGLGNDSDRHGYL
jgi:hypothetical protein